MAVKHITMPILSAKHLERFHNKYIKGSPDECWEWHAWRDKDGYGGIKIMRRSYRATRIAYFIHYEVDPYPLEVCHKCDNPPCVNPTHLFAGTMNDNVQDKRSKGRAAIGEKNGRHTHPETTVRGERVNTAQLTEGEVREILTALKAGVGLTELGRKYGVCKQAIYGIREGRTWKHIARV